MKTRYIYLIYLVMPITDLIVLNTSLLSANRIFHLQSFDEMSTIIVANYIWLMSAAFSGMYNNRLDHRPDNIFRLVFKALITFGFLFAFYTLFTRSTHLGPEKMLRLFAVFSIILLLMRASMIMVERTLKRHFRITKSVAVIGKNSTALRLADFFQGSDNHFAFEGFIHADDDHIDSRGQVTADVMHQIKSAGQNGVKEIYVSVSPDRISDYHNLQREAEKDCMRLKLVPDFTAVTGQLKLNYVGGFPVITQRNEPLEEVENRFKKRLFDLIFSTLVIVFILSWLYPILAAIIKWQSPGPVLFKQFRVGRDNRKFLCYKFRSMKMNNETEKQATKNDDRITRIGGFLRRTSMDELPQFLNVFLGDMTVVGPRPHPLSLTEQYSDVINQYMVRHFLKSGITGWAQVNGYRGETRDPMLMQKRIEHDVWYLENWSMWLDIKIIFTTVTNLLKGEENAY